MKQTILTCYFRTGFGNRKLACFGNSELNSKLNTKLALKPDNFSLKSAGLTIFHVKMSPNDTWERNWGSKKGTKVSRIIRMAP